VLLCTTLDAFTHSTRLTFLAQLEERAQFERPRNLEASCVDTAFVPSNCGLVVVNGVEPYWYSDSNSDSDSDSDSDSG
jgi:hypothetical protein